MRRKFLFGVVFVLLFSSATGQKKVDALAYGGFSTDRFFLPNERTFDVYTVGLGYKGPKTALYGFYNAGHLITDTEFTWEDQYELDFYHKIGKTTSYWLNYAYSYDPHFPQHRAMGRIWQELGGGFLISGGAKYYYFDKNLFTVTGGLEKYLGKMWIEGKTFVYLKDPTRLAYQINTRLFWNDVNYLQLSLMTGAAQDEPWRTNGILPPSLNATSARLSICTYLSKKQNLQLRAGFGYGTEEYEPDLWRDRFTGGISLTYKMF